MNIFMSKVIFCLLFSFSLIANASVRVSPVCDRSLDWDSISKSRQNQVLSGTPYVFVDSKTGSGYNAVYAVAMISAPADLTMALLSAYEDHKYVLSSLADSKVLEVKKGYALVSYTIETGMALVPNFDVISHTYVEKLTDGYLQYWRLKSSTGSLLSVDYNDGFARVETMNGKTMLYYCSYNVPSPQLFKSVANSKSFETMKTSMKQINDWAMKTNANKSKKEAYLKLFNRYF